MILSGELPCSKEEAAMLAVIQLRIDETSPQTKDSEPQPAPMVSGISMRKNSIIDDKLRPISEDLKVSYVYYI